MAELYTLRRVHGAARVPAHGTIFELVVRVFDVVFALAALVVSSPLIAAAILAVRLETPGPALFRQARMGRGGTTFSILKLRGMYIDACERFPELYDYAATPDDDPVARYFPHKGDPRVTRVGRFLRKHSLDELPNFWNVLRGDMSIVGPRPEIPELAHLYGSSLDTLLSVKPGITSPAKALQRNSLSFEERLSLDLDYVRNRSLRLNMLTIAQTALTAFRDDGVR